MGSWVGAARCWPLGEEAYCVIIGGGVHGGRKRGAAGSGIGGAIMGSLGIIWRVYMGSERKTESERGAKMFSHSEILSRGTHG